MLPNFVLLEVSQRTLGRALLFWISSLFVIWKDRNWRIFQNHFDHLDALLERVKLQTYWWLKANYIMFDFDYSHWRKNPLDCLQTVL